MHITEKNFLLPESVRDALIAYLVKRPYEEVREAIPVLLSLKENTIEILGIEK